MSGFAIPNKGDAVLAGFPNAARLDAADIRALTDGIGAKGVAYGCAVTWTSARTISVAAGRLLTPTTGYVSVALTSLSVAAAHASLDRIDVVVADTSTGVASVVTGVAAAIPLVPSLTASQIQLARVDVPALSTNVSAAAITDRRILLAGRQLVFDVRDFGALGDTNGTTGNGNDDTTAINNAATAAVAAGGILYFAPGLSFRTTAQVTIPGLCRVQGSGATIYADHDGEAVHWELTTGTRLIYDSGFSVMPDIFKVTLKWKLGTDPGSVGVRLVNFDSNRVLMPHIKSFSIGAWYDANSTHGNAYNHFQVLHSDNNKIGEQCLASDATSWVNENTLDAGRTSIDSTSYPSTTFAAAASAAATNIKVTSVANMVVGGSLRLGGFSTVAEFNEDAVIAAVGSVGSGGTGVDLVSPLSFAHASAEKIMGFTSGSRHLLIKKFAAGSVPNNNRVRARSLEGDYVDAHVELNDAADTLFDWCRYETAISRWRLLLTGGTSIVVGNRFNGGANMQNMETVVGGGTVSAAYNTGVYWDRNHFVQQASTPPGDSANIDVFNGGSAATPYFLARAAGLVQPYNWSRRAAVNYEEWKVGADIEARIRFDIANSTVQLGPGTGIAASYAVPDAGDATKNTSGQAVLRVKDATSFVATKVIQVLSSFYTISSVSGNDLTLTSNLTATVLSRTPVACLTSTTVGADSASGQPVLHLTDATGFTAGKAIRVLPSTYYSIKSVSGNDLTLTINLVGTVLAGVGVALSPSVLQSSVGTIRAVSAFGADGGIAVGGGTRIYKHLSGTKTWDPANTASGAMTSTTVTVTGAVVGDTVSVGFSIAVPAGCLLVGAVTAADTVTVTLFNISGGAVDLASGTLRADVWQH